MGVSKKKQSISFSFLKICFILAVILAITGSLWWTVSISRVPRSPPVHGYRRLQEQLLLDLQNIGEISLGSSRSKEIDSCSEYLENYVPCFNVSENIELGYSDGEEFDRHCSNQQRVNCLVLTPVNYKVPLRWPTGKDVIWVGNVKITAQEVLSSGSLTKRMMMLEEEQISFRSESHMFDGVEDYSHQIAEMIGLRNQSNFINAGIRVILDIGCGYGSFGAHLFSKQLLTICIATYESSGSQVQLTLERGLPAMIGSFNSNQLPYPALSYDLIHCSRCGIDWDRKDGIYLIEVDRVLRPGGYFVWTSPLTNSQGSVHNKRDQRRWSFIIEFAESICWSMFSQQDETVVWRKTTQSDCYSTRKFSLFTSICNKGHDVETPYYRPLQNCVGGTQSQRWIPIGEMKSWPNRPKMSSTELKIYGVHMDDFIEDGLGWVSSIHNYWSLLSPLIFSDHPKRPGGEDPFAPYNMLRNVMDMNTHFGGFNAALLESGKSVWVMNVVPSNRPNYLPLIFDRGFIGVLHNWCEPFPSYPRTYDMLHGSGLLSLEIFQHKCSIVDLFTEMNRLLRPEGNSLSGMGVSENSKNTFLELKRKKVYRYVIFQIDEKKKEVVVDKKGGPAESFDDFFGSLPENDCRYAIYDFDFVNSENCQKSKIFFIAWSPSNSRIRAKMLYATSKDRFRRELDGIHYEIQATDPTEMDIDVLKDRAN